MMVMVTEMNVDGGYNIGFKYSTWSATKMVYLFFKIESWSKQILSLEQQ